MNEQEIINTLQNKHPGKNIVRLPEENPTEIICEVEPTSAHPEYSVAISVITSSSSHYNKRSTEEYKIIHGEVELMVDGKRKKLAPGDSYTIESGVIHSAKGNSAIVRVTSHPGWTADDHILV